MTDEQFDQLMRDAAKSYHQPPADPPLEAIWQGVEQALASGAATPEPDPQVLAFEPRRIAPAWQPWMRIAAALLIGVGVGRFSAPRVVADRAAGSQPVPVVATASDDDPTHRYFGQAAALLLTLPTELRAVNSDPVFAAHAKDLLLQTRLMLDTPSSADPGTHALLEDLEVVLVQVVRLSGATDEMQRDLLTDALEQSDVIPRLRDVVVERLGE